MHLGTELLERLDEQHRGRHAVDVPVAEDEDALAALDREVMRSTASAMAA